MMSAASSKILKNPLKVLITGAAGQIGYAIAPMIGKGDAFGTNQPVNLVLHDVPQSLNYLNGTKLELEDCAFSLLTKIQVTSDLKEAFTNIDFAILLAGVGGVKNGTSRAELLQFNRDIYLEQAKIITEAANRNVRILVVANPANTIAKLLLNKIPHLKPDHITCLTRLDHNRTIAQIANRQNVSSGNLRKVIVWGNHSSTMFPDTSFAEILGADEKYHKLHEDNVPCDWSEVLAKDVRGRSYEVTHARGKNSGFSAAKAAVDHIRSWTVGTEEGDWVSMGIHSDGNHYGVPSGYFFGFPATCKDGQYKIVEGLQIPDSTLDKLKLSAEELKTEWNMLSSEC